MSASRASWSRPAEPGSVAVATAAAILVFLLSWGLLHDGFYERDEIVDTPVYERYGDAIARGDVPYRDFGLEYPPAALPAFALPSLIAGPSAPLDEYEFWFEWLLAACGVALVALMAVSLSSLGASRARTGAALGFAALAPLALGSVVLSRFDLWPAALGAAALAALLAGRARLSAAVLALAAAAKIYPLVLAPVAVAWVWRRHGRREAAVWAALFGAVLLACFVPFLVVAPDGVAASLARLLSRPLQVESIAAAALTAAGAGVEMESSHGSQNIAGTIGVVAGVVHTSVQAAALVWIWLGFAGGRMDRERLVRYSAAAVLAFVALGKVLSPQFLIWLVPLVPLVAGRRGLVASLLLGGALVLTQLWFPFRYWDYALTLDRGIAWLVLARDLVLVAALVVLVKEARGAGEEPHDELRPAARAGIAER